MATFTIHEAKTHLSRLVERAEAGEDIIIARAHTPVARLVSLARETQPRQPGQLSDLPPPPDEFFFARLSPSKLKLWRED